MASQPMAPPVGVTSRRWIGAILGRGLPVGIVHPTLAMFLGVLLGEQGTHFWLGFVVIGLAIAAVLSTAFALLTLPAALHVARVGRWGRLRHAVTFVPPAAVVAIGVTLAPLEPAGEPVPAAGIILGLVWFWLGPACWAAAIMWHVTGKLPR